MELPEAFAMISKLRAELAALKLGVSALHQEHIDLKSETASLRAENMVLHAENIALRAEIVDLKWRLSKDSRSSSKPPSSNSPFKKGTKARPHQPSGKKPGGQPGHDGNSRSMVPLCDVDFVETMPVSEQCPSCGGIAFIHRNDEVLQHITLPEKKHFVTQYNIKRVCCSKCQTIRSGNVPAEVRTSFLCSEIRANALFLLVSCRISRRNLQEAIHVLHGIDLSLGTISNLEKIATAACANAYEDIKQTVIAAPVKNVDETTGREQGQPNYSWTAGTPTEALFQCGKDRSEQSFKGFLGDNVYDTDRKDVFGADRYSLYGKLPADRHQPCFAHLIREAEGLILLPDKDNTKGLVNLGCAMINFLRDVMAIKANLFEHQRQPIELALRLDTLKENLLFVFEPFERNKYARAYYKTFIDRGDRLLNCILHPMAHLIECTNNHAERLIRPLVIWRKISLGTQAERGNRFVETMMSVMQTIKLRRLDCVSTIKDILAHKITTIPVAAL